MTKGRRAYQRPGRILRVDSSSNASNRTAIVSDRELTAIKREEQMERLKLELEKRRDLSDEEKQIVYRLKWPDFFGFMQIHPGIQKNWLQRLVQKKIDDSSKADELVNMINAHINRKGR